MSGLCVLRRELSALVLSPQTYAIGAAYLIISGVFFISILTSSEIADLEHYYANIANTLLVLVPVVAMRSFAEERRSGALEITLAWRMSRCGQVLGKFAANSLYLWCLSSIVWLYHYLVADLADIQLGRTAGGHIGLALMAMAFSALALMVSARASSPAGAAFVGFGLLLFLWILEYAPGWLGDWLEGLGPTQHFASFPRGVVYWEDVAYFVVVTLVGLGLAVAALERDRPGRKLGSLVRRGAALGAVLVVWGGTVALAGDVEGRVDLTPEKQHSTTDVTRDAIRKVRQLGEPIRLTGFAEPLSREAADLQTVVKQYRTAGARISLTVLDPDLHPGKAAEAGITGYGEALVQLGSRRELLTTPTQGSLTSILLRLSRPSPPRICFTADHGERDLADQSNDGASRLAGALRYLGYELGPVSLAAAGAEATLARCAAVVVAGAKAPFLPAELELLGAHARASGRLLVLADAAATIVKDQFNQLLEPWEISLGDGIVEDASALADDPSSIAAHDYGSGGSPPVERLHEQNIPVVLTRALPVEGTPAAEEQGAFIALVRSSQKSWIREGTGDGTVGRQGPFVLAALADWSSIEEGSDGLSIARTRIGVVGSAELAANRMIDFFGNRDLVTKLVQWIAQEDDVISAGRPPGGYTKIVLTGDEKGRIIRQGIVFPTLLLLVPLPLAALRLRRG